MPQKQSHIILWNRNWQVSAFVIGFNRSGGCSTVFTMTGSPEDSFSEQLAAVHQALKPYPHDAIIIGGHIPESFFLELVLPLTTIRDLGDVLTFELPRQVPFALEEMIYFYRIVENCGNHSRIRIFLCPRAAWNNCLNVCSESGIVFDAYCHVYMAVEAAHDSESIYLPDHNPDFVWMQADGHPVALREYRLLDTVPTVTEHPEYLVAEYVFKERFHRDKRYLSNQPSALKPQRLRPLKFSAIIMAILALIFIGALWYRHYDDAQARQNALAQEFEDIEYALIAQQEGMDKLLLLSDSAEKILETVDKIDPLTILAALSSKLPPHAWVHSLRTSGGKVALTIAVKGETDSVAAALNQDISDMAVESLRQQLNNDGSSTMTVILQKTEGVHP